MHTWSETSSKQHAEAMHYNMRRFFSFDCLGCVVEIERKREKERKRARAREKEEERGIGEGGGGERESRIHV